jgi:uncharacterized membrane protein
MLGVDIACLAALVAAFIMKAFPLTHIAGQVLEWVAAISNAVTTGVVIGAIVILVTTYALEMDKISKKGEFTKLRIDNDPNKRYGEDAANDTFIDLDLDWLTTSP